MKNFRFPNLIFMFLVVGAGVYTPASDASENFIHPSFTSSREFVFEEPEPATRVFAGAHHSTEVLVFEKASSFCKLDLHQIQKQFSNLLNSQSYLWKTL